MHKHLWWINIHWQLRFSTRASMAFHEMPYSKYNTRTSSLSDRLQCSPCDSELTCKVCYSSTHTEANTSRCDSKRAQVAHTTAAAAPAWGKHGVTHETTNHLQLFDQHETRRLCSNSCLRFLRKLLMWSLDIWYIYIYYVLLNSCACHSCSSTARIACGAMRQSKGLALARRWDPNACSWDTMAWYRRQPTATMHVNASTTWLTRSFGGCAKRELHKTSLRLWMDTYGNFHVIQLTVWATLVRSNIYVQYEICWSWMWWLGGSFGLTLTHLNPSEK
jgi:hypothetical protein